MNYPDNSRALSQEDWLQPPEEYPEFETEFGIIDARVNWMEEWGNSPILEILVEKVLNVSDFRYDLIDRERSDLYFGYRDGQVSYFVHDKNNERGFGGATYILSPAEPNRRIPYKVKGPWTSRSSVMNNFFKHSMEARLIDNEAGFEKGFTFMSGAVSMPMALEALDHIHVSTGEIYALAYHSLYEDLSELEYQIVKMDTSGDEPVPVFKGKGPEDYILIGILNPLKEEEQDDEDRWYSELQENQDFAQDDELSNGGQDIL